MKIVLIFDSGIGNKSLCQFEKHHDTYIDLFSLTSNLSIIDKIKNELDSNYINVSRINDSAKMIYSELKTMHETIHSWSSSLGCHQIRGKKFKEWFLLPDKQVSSWWFGLLSEKNTAKDDVFFKIAQANAIKNHVQQNNYDLCVIALSDKSQRKVIKNILKGLRIKTRCVPYEKNYNLGGVKLKLLSFINQFGMLGAFIRGARVLAYWFNYGRIAKRILGPIEDRLPKENPFLFVSYFPNIDMEAEQQGKFRNKYGTPIQDKLYELNIPITWLMILVPYNGHNLESAIKLAKRLSDNGEKILVMGEFVSIRLLLKGTLWWLFQVAKGVGFYYFTDKKILTRHLTSQECLPYVKYLWQHSFVGLSCVAGIIDYLLYRNVFKSIPKIGDCLYYCEMQAWEKALNAAKKIESPATRTLGFQHTVVERNHYKYFYHWDDVRQSNKPTDMPLPDLLISNGRFTHSLLNETQYSNLCQAEAVRQLYLSNILDKEYVKSSSRPILLVVGVLGQHETMSLISMVYRAFPVANQFDIWFKGYPCTPLESIFADLGIDVNESNYKIVHSDIAVLLEAASAVFVPSSTVALEAVAFGCSVIIPLFPDTMLMNPLVDAAYHDYSLITSTDDFKARVEDVIFKNRDAVCEKSKEFVKNYWNLDKTLPLWTSIFLKN